MPHALRERINRAKIGVVSIRSRQIMSDPGLLILLGADERLRTVVGLKPMVQGAERTGPADGETPPRDSAARAAGGFLAGNWVPRWARGDLVERAIGGVALQGSAGSLAAGLRRASLRGDGLAVTDQRLIVVHAGKTAMAADPAHPGRRIPSTSYTTEWSTPIGDVIAARRAGRLVGAGRVELVFRDSSRCAVVTGVVSSTAARRLLECLRLPEKP